LRVQFRVDLNFVEHDFLAPGVDLESIHQSFHGAIVPKVAFEHISAGEALPFHFEMRLRVDEIDAVLSVFHGDNQLIGHPFTDLFLTGQLDPVAFGFIVDQRSFEIGAGGQIAEFLGRNLLRLSNIAQTTPGPAGNSVGMRVMDLSPNVTCSRIMPGRFISTMNGPLSPPRRLILPVRR
jgi:hypothetical protein